MISQALSCFFNKKNVQIFQVKCKSIKLNYNHEFLLITGQGTDLKCKQNVTHTKIVLMWKDILLHRSIPNPIVLFPPVKMSSNSPLLGNTGEDNMGTARRIIWDKVWHSPSGTCSSQPGQPPAAGTAASPPPRTGP